jgi:uncharacterized damage-inducible protein DinB
MVRVEHVLNSWKTARYDAAATVEEFPADDFGFRPTPDVDSFAQIALHILNAGAGLTGMMLAGESDFTVPGFRDRMKEKFTTLTPESGGAAIAAAMRESIDGRTAELAKQPAEWWAQTMTWFDGSQMTRQELLLFFKEHELTHRSQLFMYQRLKGMVPVTTRRRRAQQAAAK